MATYLDSAGNVYTHDDDKLGFDDWVANDGDRWRQWLAAAEIHKNWQAANPSAHPSSANDDANRMFDEWIAYANATRPTSA